MSLSTVNNVSFAKRSTRVFEPEDVMVILFALIFTTFKRRGGLYFFSLVFSSLGVAVYATGWLVDYFNLTLDFVGMILASAGWALMVTGQAVVLYSRLHLVLMNDIILRSVKWMIICNGVVWHTSMTVLLFTISYRPDQQRASYSVIFNIMEKVQMTFFCLQEFILSGIYVWKTGDILKTSFDRPRRLIWQLLIINILIVLMDISLLVVEFTDNFLWQQGLKVVMYSIKLKLEFAVLGRLVEFVQHGGESHSSHGARLTQINSHRTKSTCRANSSPQAEVIHMEDMSAELTITSAEGSSHSEPTKLGKITVTRNVDVHNRPVGEDDRRSNKSTDELFLHAL